MRLRSLLVVLLLAAPLALAQDDAARAPVNPFTNATVGDWELLAIKGEPERLEEWTVLKVDDENVVVKIARAGEKAVERTFSRKTEPAIADLFPEKTFTGALSDVKEGKATLPVSGQEFKCHKVRFKGPAGDTKRSATLCVSDAITGGGVIERAVDGGEKASIVGYGTKGKTTWGRAPKEK